MGVSQHATVSLEEIAEAAPGCPRWFQLYILKDRGLTANILRRWVGDLRKGERVPVKRDDIALPLKFEVALVYL